MTHPNSISINLEQGRRTQFTYHVFQTHVLLVLLSSLDPQQVCAKIADFGTAQAVTAPITDIKVENPRWQG